MKLPIASGVWKKQHSCRLGLGKEEIVFLLGYRTSEMTIHCLTPSLLCVLTVKMMVSQCGREDSWILVAH